MHPREIFERSHPWQDLAEGAATLSFEDLPAKPHHRLALGPLKGVRRWTALRRTGPYWMTPEFGDGPLPVETQFALLDLGENGFGLLTPLLDEPARCSLEGSLTLVAESGDSRTPILGVTGLYAAVGPDPYTLIQDAAGDVASFLGTVRLRDDRPVPAFADDFGWCTWDAFYHEVSHAKVREGLESWRASGVRPRFLVLDDGWQPVWEGKRGEKRLTGLGANDKFPGGLRETVAMAKDDFGISTFMVWHAAQGYWGGVDLPEYKARATDRRSSEGVRTYTPDCDTWFGLTVGLIPPKEIHRFYHDYHRELAAEGVDGVKIDGQGTLEAVAEGLAGRVALARHYREAMEGAAAVHFGGNLIHCMACSTDLLYHTRVGSLTRTSDDFYPTKPESHGAHLAINAFVGAWFGEFVQPDWDMFQSGHEMGAFHAAGRAVSGGPVYVSDKPGTHDVALLKQLVLNDGSVYRARTPGVPFPDSLFDDPIHGEHTLRVVAQNDVGLITGLFNCRHGEDAPTVTAEVVGEELGLKDCAIRLYRAGTVHVDQVTVQLGPLDWEIAWIAPVQDGVAFLGLEGFMNGNAAILDAAGAACEIDVPDGGILVAYSEEEPSAAFVDGEEVGFEWTASTLRLSVKPGARSLALAF